MGGSESMIVELTSRLQSKGDFNVIVFCNCVKEETYENVRYFPLEELFYAVHAQPIHTCIVSRYSEYLPVAINSKVENIFLMSHDTAFSGNVITIHPKLKGVICLGNWHSQHIVNQFPSLSPLIKTIGHGIDVSNLIPTNKIPYKFIYSSLANRGLYKLLTWWPKIIEWQPSATLHIYCNVDSQYMLDTFGEEMNKIRHLINTNKGIVYHGYVDKKPLYESWKTADVWVYPTEFNETFCVTALEAAASKTLVIASNLAGLKETVANRGILMDDLNEDDALHAIIKTMENVELKQSLIQANYEWALKNTWDSQVLKLEELIMSNKFQEINWTTNSKLIDIFNKHVKQAAKILEIGVGTGIYLLSMVKLVQDSTGLAICDCDPELYPIFDANVRHSDIANRIMRVKSETTFNGLMLLVNNAMFDVIYLNNKSDLLDCYSELSVIWGLLNDGGLLVVDNLLDKRIIALHQVLSKHKNHTILCKEGEMVFIIKPKG